MIKINIDKLKQKLFILVIFLTAILGIFVSDIYLPSLNSISKEFMIHKSLVSFSVTLYFIFFAIFQLLYGVLSDKYGRRIIFILGLIIGTVGTIIIIASQSFIFLVIGRVLEAIGMASPVALSRIIIREYITDNKSYIKFMSFFNIGILITPIIAPIIGSILEIYLYWKADFIFILILNLFCLFLSYYFLIETNKLPIKKINLLYVLKTYLWICKNSFFVKQIIISGITIAAILLYLSMSSFLFQDHFNMSIETYSYIFVACASFIMIGMLFNNIMIKYIKIYYIQQTAIIIFFVSSILFFIQALFFSNNFIMAIISIINFNFSAGIIFNTSNILAIIPFKKRLSTISGIYGCFIMLIGSLLSSIITTIPINVNYLISSSFFLMSFIALIVSISCRKIYYN